MFWKPVVSKPPQSEKVEEAPQDEAEPVVPLPTDAEVLFQAAFETYLTELRAQNTSRATSAKSTESLLVLMGKPVPGTSALRQRARECVRTWFDVDTDNDYPDVKLTRGVVDIVVEQAHLQLLLEAMGSPRDNEPLDGAELHSVDIKSSIETREKKRLDNAIQRLTELANTPISFDSSTTDADDPVSPQAAYAEFAGQLRAQGLDETSVFDLVAQLAKFIKQSEEILPRVTKTVARQLEARVLLSYYKELEAVRAKKQEEAEQKQMADDARADARAQTQASLDQAKDIAAQLSSLNAVAERQAKDTSMNTFLHIIDGLFGH